MTTYDHRLYFIEQVEHRRHVIKIVRRGDRIKLLIYPPGALFATQMIVEALSNYEEALQNTKVAIERMIREPAVLPGKNAPLGRRPVFGISR